MNAYIFDAVRTVRGKGNKNGALLPITPTQLGAQLLAHYKDQKNLDPKLVEDLMLGCVTQVMDQGANIAKTIAQVSNYGDHLCGYTLNRFCGSGLEAINQAAAYTKSGYKNLVFAGGVESMSRVAMGADGGAMAVDPAAALYGMFIPQGVSADLIATREGYSRQDLDAFAVESQKRALNAEKNGYFKSRIPVKDINGFDILIHDENVRESSLESLAKLNPSFEMMGKMGGFDAVALDRYPEVSDINHVHHPGNSSAIVDGAAVAIVGNEEGGKAAGLTPRAKIVSMAMVGTDPTIMLTGPVPATELALKNAGMNINDIDLFEVNEAFAAIPMYFMDKLNVAHDKVNVNGGAIALGHPLGATGCMLMGTLIDELERRDLQTGLVTLCIGGGMGIATIIERV